MGWKSYGFVVLGAGLAFIAGRSGRAPALPASGTPAAAPMLQERRWSAVEAVAKQSSDPVAVVGWIRGASPAELESVIKDLTPLHREAAWLRLSETDPARFATVLLDNTEIQKHGPGWSRWFHWLTRRHPEAVKQRLDRLDPSDPLRQTVLMGLHAARLEKAEDPAEMIDLALAGAAEPGTLERAIPRLALEQPEQAAAAFCRTIDAGMPLRLADPALLSLLVKADADGLRKRLPQVRTPELHAMLSRALAAALAEVDPQQAFAFHGELPPSRGKSLAAIEIAIRLAGRDNALAWVEALPEGSAKAAAMAAFYSPLADRDPRRVLTALDGYRKLQGSLASYSYQFVSGRPVSGQLAGVGSSPSVDAVRERALTALAARDPGAAFAILKQEREAISAPPFRIGHVEDIWADRKLESLLAKVIVLWIGQDPVAALKAIDDLPPGDRRSILGKDSVTAALRELPADRVPDALEVVSKMIELGAAGMILEQLAPAMLRDDPAAALQAVELVGSDLRDVWIDQVITNLHRTDPAAAISEAAKLPPALRITAHSAIARGLAARSPSEAIAYLDGLPSRDRAIGSYEGVIERCFVRDPGGAVTWYHALPATDRIARQAALLVMAGHLYDKDPLSADVLADAIAGIGDVDQRAKAMEKFLLAMARKDPAAARVRLATLGKEFPLPVAVQLREKIESEIKSAAP